MFCRVPIVRSLGLVAILAGSAMADWGQRYAPTVYVDALPTSYIVPTSYVYSPTVYTTSYWATSAYSWRPTSYVLRPTYYVTPTTYLTPTVSYVRTSYVTPLRRTAYFYDVTPASYWSPTAYTWTTRIADDCVTTAAPVVSSSEPAATSAQESSKPGETSPLLPPRGQNGGGGQTPKNLSSTPKSASGDQGEPEPPLDNRADPGRPEPAPERTDNPLNDPAVSPPTSSPGTGSSRDSLRPAPTVYAPRTDLAPPGTLRVEVVSGVSGKAEVGVKVVFSDRRQRFDDKTATTDANGLLSVFLPEGDWAVRIDEGAAAQNKTYDAVTSSGGKFMDPSGRAIYSLRLSR